MVDNPKVALHILDATNSSRYLELRGDATVEPDHDYAFADRLGAKYGGLNLRAMDRPGEHRTVVTINVTRARAVDMRVPGHGRVIPDTLKIVKVPTRPLHEPTKPTGEPEVRRPTSSRR